MEIITTPDPRLREKSEKVGKITDEVREVIAEMRRLSLEWEKEHPYEMSAAMAAPQMGVNKRIIIVRDSLEDKRRASFTALINPEVVRTKGRMVTDFEGCLSVPFVYAKVPRPSKAYVRALTEDGRKVEIRADKEMARTLLHEIDHLEGILFVDRVRKVRDAFYEMNEKGKLVPLDYDEKIRGNKELFPDG